jgi:hypothetical protein
MRVRRVIKFEFEGGHDIEFMLARPRVWEVWIDGVRIEEMPTGARPSEARAFYYLEVHYPSLGETFNDRPEIPGLSMTQ